jgi:hypothetical protein
MWITGLPVSGFIVPSFASWGRCRRSACRVQKAIWLKYRKGPRVRTLPLPYFGTNLKNHVAVEIWILHSKPCTNSHIHFLSIVESATSIGFSNSVPSLLLSRPESPIPSTDKCSHHYRRPFASFRNLCAFLWHDASSLRHQHIRVPT